MGHRRVLLTPRCRTHIASEEATPTFGMAWSSSAELSALCNGHYSSVDSRIRPTKPGFAVECRGDGWCGDLFHRVSDRRPRSSGKCEAIGSKGTSLTRLISSQGAFTTKEAISEARPLRMSSKDAPRQLERVSTNASASSRSARSAACAMAVVRTASSATAWSR